MTDRDLHERARAIRLLILDVDGVMTDGSLYFSSRGEELKRFDVQDGLGLRMLASDGVQLAIISGRRSEAVERRAENLGIHELVQGVDDKLEESRALAARLGVAFDAIGAIGDDLPDLPLLRRAVFSATVPAAPAIVRENCHYVTARAGGQGAVRELCELILNARGAMARTLERYLD